jgi:hypothetical protein
MIIIRETEEQGQFLRICQERNSLTLEMLEKTGEDTPEVTSQITIDLNSIFKPRSAFGIYTDLYGKFVEPINVSNISTIRDNPQTVLARRSLRPTQWLTIFFYDDVSQVIITSVYPAVTTNPYTVRTEVITDAELIRTVYPDHAAAQETMKARMEINLQSHPNEILACQEAQIDFLTKLVLTLLDTASPETKAAVKEIPHVQDFIDIFSATNVMTVKATDKCLTEMENGKKKIRKLQDNYFKVKGGYNEGIY